MFRLDDLSLFDETLKDFYPKDEEVARNFANKTLTGSNNKLARYILSEINSHYQDNKELVANPNAIDLNLEHILPQKPSGKWLEEFSNTKPDEYIYRLGNMTLLDSSLNRKIGNTSFQEKCDTAFSKSQLEINKEILNCQKWSPNEIEERQKKMAKAACQIWRLNY